MRVLFHRAVYLFIHVIHGPDFLQEGRRFAFQQVRQTILEFGHAVVRSLSLPLDTGGEDLQGASLDVVRGLLPLFDNRLDLVLWRGGIRK